MEKAGFHNNEHAWQSGESNGKLEPETPVAQPPKCPQCGSVMRTMELPDNLDREICRIKGGEIIYTAIITDVLFCPNCRLAVLQAERKVRAS